MSAAYTAIRAHVNFSGKNNMQMYGLLLGLSSASTWLLNYRPFHFFLQI